MTGMYTWVEAARQAREDLGFPGPEIPRTVTAVADALRPALRNDFHRELATLPRGSAFDVFLDHWWTQAIVDTARDEDGREAALEFADLAVTLRITHDSTRQ